MKKDAAQRALHIITRFATGGAEESVLEQISALDKAGFVCDLAIGREYNPQYLKKYSLPTHSQIKRIPSLVHSPHPYHDLKAVHEIKRLIREGQYDIVHTHGSKAGILGRFAAYRARVPVVLHTVHGTSFSQRFGRMLAFFYTMLERRAARWCDALISVGEDLKQILIQHKIGRPEQHHVIYTGMTLKAFETIHFERVHKPDLYLANRNRALQKLSETTGKPIPLQNQKLHGDIDRSNNDEREAHNNPPLFVGMIARFEKVKNHRAFIEIIRPLLSARSNLFVVLFGAGPELEAIKKIVASYQLDDRVLFVGHVSNLPEYLYAIDINCLCSLIEGLPRALVQCAAAGIPTVCFKVEGVWEIIENQKSGIIITRNDKTLDRAQVEFSEALAQMLDSDKKRYDMGQRASESAISRWSLEELKEKSATLYKYYINIKTRSEHKNHGVES